MKEVKRRLAFLFFLLAIAFSLLIGRLAQIQIKQDCYEARAIPAPVAAQLREMMELVATEGVGQKAYVPILGSAGKTGSAQVGSKGKVNAWFVGYAPLQHPRYVAAVLVEEGISGGETAAPVFREIMERILAGSH